MGSLEVRLNDPSLFTSRYIRSSVFGSLFCMEPLLSPPLVLLTCSYTDNEREFPPPFAGN